MPKHYFTPGARTGRLRPSTDRSRAMAVVPNTLRRPRVVIVGTGFGGLSAAKTLADVPVGVTVIDRRNYHLFQPLLYQVATAGLSPADIASPIRTILRGQDNVSVMLATVTGAGSAARADRQITIHFLRATKLPLEWGSSPGNGATPCGRTPYSRRT